MKSKATIPLSTLPANGLSFFHGLSNWIEQNKTSKHNLAKWKQGIKALSILKCNKLQEGERIPEVLPRNTLYVPKKASGIMVFRHLRNAFCHNDLEYDNKTKQYRIELTGKVKITGRFSLEAIEDFVSVFLSKTKQQSKK